MLYMKLMVTANQKPVRETQKNKKSKCNTKERLSITKEESKRQRTEADY